MELVCYTHIMSPNFSRVWANANVSGPLPAATRLRLPNACVPGGNDGGGACAPLFLVTPSPMMAMLSSSPKTLVFVKRAIGDEPLLRRAPTPPNILVWRKLPRGHYIHCTDDKTRWCTALTAYELRISCRDRCEKFSPVGHINLFTCLCESNGLHVWY